MQGSGVYAEREISRWPEHVPCAAVPLFLPSISTHSTYSTELLKIQGILDVPKDVGFRSPASSPLLPGRTAPAPCPRRPITPRAPEGLISTLGPCLGGPRQRTPDPMVKGCRPGTSALETRQRPFPTPDSPATPEAGHSGVTAQRVAQRHHRYRTCRPSPAVLGPDVIGPEGGGDNKNPIIDRTSSPLPGYRAAVSTDRLVSTH